MEQRTVTQAQYLEDDAAVQLLSDVERIIGERTGMTTTLAAPMARLLVDGLRDTYGGQRLYIPAPKRRSEQLAERAQRDAAMVAMFNGRNLAEVMREFGVSRRTVYNAVQRARQTVQAPA
jgi:Mor family transcriptional regulator